MIHNLAKWFVVMCGLGAMSSPALAEIRIGGIFSVTGLGAFMGEPQKRSLEMLADQINAAGGVNGERIRVFIYDDGADANKARTFAQRLIEQDKVHAIIGPTLTASSLAVNAVASDAKVPLLTLAGGVQLVEPLQKWMFKVGHTDRMACERIFRDMKERGISRVAMMSANDGFGTSMRTECLNMVQRHGITVVADERYGPRDSDVTPQLTNIRKTPGLQAVISPGFGESATVVTRNFRQLGIQVPLYQSHGVGTQGFITATGPAADGVRLPATAILIADKLTPDDPQRSVVQKYARDYQTKYNEAGGYSGSVAYDALNLVVGAIKRAGAVDSVKIREAMENLGAVPGVAAVYRFTSTDHLGLDTSAFHMVEIRGGNWTLIGDGK